MIDTSAPVGGRARRRAPDRFEFQMLYGVRRDLQALLAASGYRVRVYVPFGRQWFPYFMRRLGERPANVAIRSSRASSTNVAASSGQPSSAVPAPSTSSAQ